MNEGEETVPQIQREGDMNSGKGGNNVILSGTDETFSRVGAVVVGGDKLRNTRRLKGLKESANSEGSFVVRNQVAYVMAQ